MEKMNNEINLVNSFNELVDSEDHHVTLGRDDAGQQAPPAQQKIPCGYPRVIPPW